MKVSVRWASVVCAAMLFVYGVALAAQTATANTAVNMRKGPGTSYSTVKKVSKGTSMTVLESKNSWVKVRLSGGSEGWISSSYVTIKGDAQTAASSAPAATAEPTAKPVEPTAEMKKILELTNDKRKGKGRKALAFDSTLNEKAAIRAKELASKFSHTRPDGTKVGPWLLKGSYTSGGENIAKTSSSGESAAKSVYQDWIDRPADMGNMMSASYKRVGIGTYTDGGTTYWIFLVTN